ncbi:hypothetical protein B1813_07200 [Saccharomonospora piscinae]|uniref:Uncharacterized protein n=1 Tax=Saccharomonospora piscinae TaxID=687388 RepID=A0A1V9A4J5_SACPI|nr:hypothetical protein [Saccharomonospora piscinae]OQO92049.1 hypothetical protein B1813_07200 [Saccharomonospora piscinae]
MAHARARAVAWPGTSTADARQFRLDVEDVEHWEHRRRGRHARLWVVSLVVHAAARDADDAALRLTRYVRQPQHRIGDVPILRASGLPEPGAAGSPTTYPGGAVAHHDPAPYGALERAHVAAYVQALAAARLRWMSDCATAPLSRLSRLSRLSPVTEDDAPVYVRDSSLTLWRVRHRVLCLAGPGEAQARAAELAATVVDDAGVQAAEVTRLRADDGYVDVEGWRVHPALTLAPRATTALWDDYDRTESDAGQPAAVAEVLGRAAVSVWKAFTSRA